MSITASRTRRTTGAVALLGALFLLVNVLLIATPATAATDGDRRPCNEYGYEKFNSASGSETLAWGSMTWGSAGGTAGNELAYDIAEGWSVEFCIKAGNVDNTFSGPLTGTGSIFHENPSISHVGYRVVATPTTDAEVSIDQACAEQGPAATTITLDNTASTVTTTFRVDLDDRDATFHDVAPGASTTLDVAADDVLVRWFDVDADERRSASASFDDECEQPEPPTISLVKVFLDEDGTWLSPEEPPAVLVELFDGSSTDTTALLTVNAESLYAGPAVLGESTYTVTEAPIDGWAETACTDEVLTEFQTSATGTGEFAAPQDDTTHVVCNAPEDTPPPPVVSPTAAAVVECDTAYVELDNSASTAAVEFTITGTEGGTIVETVAAGASRTVDIVLVEDAAYSIAISAEGMDTVTAEGTWDCEQTEVEPDVTVRPEVTFAEPTCDDQDAAAVNAVDVDGVAYGLTGEIAPGGTVMVTATAADGYTLAEDAQTAWTHTFDDLADCEEDEVDVEPEATEKPQPAPQPAPAQELAATGFDSTDMLLLALLLMGLGAAALLAPEPRRER